MTTARSNLHAPRALRSLALAAALVLPALAGAEVLYSQPFAVDSPNGGWWSSTVEQKLPFDRFTLTNNARVESVTWYGMGIEEALGLPPAHPASFTISFYADGVGSMPGTLLGSTTVGGSANPVDTGINVSGVISVFRYNATLSTPLQLSAGTTYWIGITDPTSYASWFWGSGIGGDGVHSQLVAGVPEPNLAEDLSFTLDGTVGVVPEPASALLFMLGAAGLAARLKRQRG